MLNDKTCHCCNLIWKPIDRYVYSVLTSQVPEVIRWIYHFFGGGPTILYMCINMYKYIYIYINFIGSMVSINNTSTFFVDG